MKTIYGILILIGWMVIGYACSDDENLSPEFEYNGPIPAIADGPSNAQKICYDLYKKYDYHVYYTLSGDDALRTNVGTTQINMFYYLPEDTFPLEPGDELTSESFLKLLKTFYAYLPEEIVKTSNLKRQVLVKANLWNDELTNYYGFWIPEYYAIGFTDEAQQGIIYWGDMNDEIGVQPDVWKYSICLSFFRTRTSLYFYKDLPLLTEFSQVSAGKYLNEMTVDEQIDAMDNLMDWETYELNVDLLMNLGFVHAYPFMMASTKSYQNEDMATYATWIACNPLEERQEILAAYPLVKSKYELTLKYYKNNLQLDLEAFSKFWLNLEVE